MINYNELFEKSNELAKESGLTQLLLGNNYFVIEMERYLVQNL